MSPPEPTPVPELTVDALHLLVLDDRSQVGRAAAPSQDEFLAGLVAHPSIEWGRVVAFHMDEYLGLGPDHRASFRRYLHEHLFRLAGLTDDRLRLIPGERAERPLQTCLIYEDV